MKTTHIVIIVVIAVAIGIIITSAGDSSTYVNFDQAHEMSLTGNKNNIHVVGELKKDYTGKVTGITPGDDKVSFSFVMIDDKGKEQLVQYNQPMPADFTRSEKVVVIGRYQNDSFIADKILLKCPSKYQEQQVITSEG
jgi:cytochrome c-type biogenesis protein CcmE